jgi:hypothetical protein
MIRQAWRDGGTRPLILPHESHGYRVRESVLHVIAEMFDWAERHAGRCGRRLIESFRRWDETQIRRDALRRLRQIRWCVRRLDRSLDGSGGSGRVTGRRCGERRGDCG